jgi:hypothetical protein
VEQQQPASSVIGCCALCFLPLFDPKKYRKQPVPTMKQATGKITTSGTVVTGHATSFDKEFLNQGDALIIMRGDEQEMRIVT